MNLQSLVVVLLRLVSLNFLEQVFFQLVPLLSRFSQAYQHMDRDEFRSVFVLPFVVILGIFICAALLWVLAMPIARFVTRGLAPDLSLGWLSLADCYSIVLVGVGLFYAAGHFATVLNWAHYLLKMEASRQDDDWKKDMHWYDFSRELLTFIVGIVLFVNSRKWAVAIANRQMKNAADSAPTNPEQPTDI